MQTRIIMAFNKSRYNHLRTVAKDW